MADNPHSGHRDRLRKRFLSENFDGMEKHEILEFVLYYSIPRKDTNPIAHHLLDTFGSISAVFDAPVDTLKEAGLSEACAVYLKMLPQISRVYMDDRNNNFKKYVDMDNLGDIMKHKYIGRDYEAVILLLMDSKNKELFCGVVNKGSVSSSEIYIRKVIELAVMYNARYAVLSHNHPSGMAWPSSDDIETTRKVSESLSLIGVKLLEHIIVADDDYIEIYKAGFMG